MYRFLQSMADTFNGYDSLIAALSDSDFEIEPRNTMHERRITYRRGIHKFEISGNNVFYKNTVSPEDDIQLNFREAAKVVKGLPKG